MSEEQVKFITIEEINEKFDKIIDDTIDLDQKLYMQELKNKNNELYNEQLEQIINNKATEPIDKDLLKQKLILETAKVLKNTLSFEIINIFANPITRNELIQKAKKSEHKVKQQKENSEETQDIKTDLKNHLFTTDIHGDLGALLFTLVGNEDPAKNPARFSTNCKVTKYFDLVNKKTVDSLELIPKNEIINLIPMPNLEPNPDFKGKFTFGGDIINRGPESEACFCTIVDLLNQQQKILKTDLTQKPKIYFIFGNHEEFLLINDTDGIIFNGGNTTAGNNILDLEERSELMSKIMLDLLKNNDINICYSEGNTIISHATFEKSDFNRVINLLKKDNSLTDLDKINITKEELEQLKILQQEKLIESSELNFTSEDTNLLTKVINKVGKACYNPDLALIDKYGGIFNIDNKSGILWNRVISEDKIKFSKQNILNGVINIFGHTNSSINNIYKIGNGFLFFGDRDQSVDENGITNACNVRFDENGQMVEHICSFERELIHEICQEHKLTILKEQAKQLKRLEESTKEIGSLTDKPITKAIE